MGKEQQGMEGQERLLIVPEIDACESNQDEAVDLSAWCTTNLPSGQQAPSNRLWLNQGQHLLLQGMKHWRIMGEVLLHNLSQLPCLAALPCCLDKLKKTNIAATLAMRSAGAELSQRHNLSSPALATYSRPPQTTAARAVVPALSPELLPTAAR